MLKKLTALLLTLTMLLCLMPAVALGEEGSDGGDITNTGLDLRTATATNYTTTGNGTVVWNKNVTPNTLTFTNATINAPGNGYGDGSAIILPESTPITVVFNGENHISFLGGHNAKVITCNSATTFDLTEGSTTVLGFRDLGASNAIGISLNTGATSFTIGGKGALKIDSKSNFAIYTKSTPVILNGITLASDGSTRIGESSVTLNGITVPEGKELNLNYVTSITYGENTSKIDGNLIMPLNRPYTKTDFDHFTGDGTITLVSRPNSDLVYTPYSTSGYKEIKALGLDLTNPPTEPTQYATGGTTPTITWTPTVDNGTLTRGTLLLSGATIEAKDGLVTAITLPNVPVTVLLTGTNSISGGTGFENGFVCGNDTTFVFYDSEMTITAPTGIDGNNHDITIDGVGKLVINGNNGGASIENPSNLYLKGGTLAFSHPITMGAGVITLGGITVPQNIRLKIEGNHNINKGTDGALNYGTIVLPVGFDATKIKALGLVPDKDGFVEIPSNLGDTAYYYNDGTKIPSMTSLMDFTKSAQDGGWNENATVETDGYKFTKDVVAPKLELGNFLLACNVPNTPAMRLPSGVEVVLTEGTTTRITSGNAAMQFVGSAKISGKGRLELICNENNASAALDALGILTIAAPNINISAKECISGVISAPNLIFYKTAVINPTGTWFDSSVGKLRDAKGDIVKSATIGEALPSAVVDGCTISGTQNVALSPLTFKVTLVNETFGKALDDGTDARAWLTKIPAGVIVTVSGVTKGGTTATITISGTPTEEFDQPVVALIPSEILSYGETISADVKPQGARWSIAEQGVVAAPVISPSGGTYSGAQTVTISCGTKDAKIYYNTNGTEPTENDTLYTAPFTVSSSMTIVAKAFAANMKPSAAVAAAYTISSKPDPRPDPAPVPDPVPVNTNPGATTIFNDPISVNLSISLTGKGLMPGDKLVTEPITGGEVYKQFVQLIDAKTNKIIGVFEMHTKSGKIASDGMYMDATVGKQYAGMELTLLHQMADKTYEYFYATVTADGEAKFGPISTLSPFMLVLGHVTPKTVAVTGQPIPQTGDAGSAAGYVMLAVAMLAAIAALADRRRARNR